MTKKSTSNSDLQLVIKYDYELTQRELMGVFLIYNECFYQNRVRDKLLIIKVKKWLGKSKLFKWYLLKKAGKVVAIASYVYNYDNLGEFDINPQVGENLCNVAVKNKHQGKGYASKVIKALMDDCSDVKLVLEIKKESLLYVRLEAWYRSLGFKTLLESDEQIYLEYFAQSNQSI